MICALQDGDLDAQLFTRAELALLKFAGKVNANSSGVTRDDVEAAMRAGWTEAQVAEAVHIAALFAAFNRVANGFGLPTPYPDGL
jgi:alkylhydroperoxidase family enzyme